MIKCVECGKEIINGGPRYATPDGSFCCDCWEKKDQGLKDAMLIHITDLSIENNRLRTKLADLEKAHSDFSYRMRFWVFWIMLGLGVAAGIIFSNSFK